MAGGGRAMTPGRDIHHLRPAQAGTGRRHRFVCRTLVRLVERSRQGIEYNEAAREHELVSYLDGFQPARFPLIGPRGCLKSIEKRFHLDLGTERGGAWWSQRRITAIVTRGRAPLGDERVRWELAGGGSRLGLLASGLDKGGKPEDASLTLELQTDARGLCEVALVHCVESLPSDRRILTIRATADGEIAELELTITRNDDVPDLDEVMADPSREGHADALLLYEPAAPTAPTHSVETLQEMLNQVVARHKGINSFTFVPRDGRYGQETRDAVKLYLDRFRTIVAGNDWPYDLSQIGIYPSLRDYVNTEYAPFRYGPDTHGWIVDRRLLIGRAADIRPANIDGLHDLYRGVVEPLVTGMTTMAGRYLESSTFWLHRPMHPPYRRGTQVGAVEITRPQVTVRQGPAGAPLVDTQGSQVRARRGSRLACLGQAPVGAVVWYEVRVSAAQSGWIRQSEGRPILNDRAHDCNSGLFGSNGVAYTFGGKDTPDEFVHFISTNDPGVADIINWAEYTRGHKPGLTKAELQAGARRVDWTGIDCSGFCQHCITAAVFPGTTVRIVPEAVLRAIVNRGRYSVGAAGAVGRYARRVPYENSLERQWIRGGDVIATATHIVWVAGAAGDMPDTLNNNRAFDVLNAFGDTGTAAVQATQFVRKTIRMPFSWWGIQLAANSTKIGRVYIWC